jgi:hypothetical protein
MFKNLKRKIVRDEIYFEEILANIDVIYNKDVNTEYKDTNTLIRHIQGYIDEGYGFYGYYGYGSYDGNDIYLYKDRPETDEEYNLRNDSNIRAWSRLLCTHVERHISEEVAEKELTAFHAGKEYEEGYNKVSFSI